MPAPNSSGAGCCLRGSLTLHVIAILLNLGCSSAISLGVVRVELCDINLTHGVQRQFYTILVLERLDLVQGVVVFLF